MELIEFVCTGNRGRSVPAEMIAQNHLKQIGADHEYRAISSGTSVDDIRTGKASTPFMIRTIGMARNRGDVYTPGQLQQIDEAIGQGSETVLKKFYDLATQTFGEEEERYRAEVLPELGVVGKIKNYQEQTIAGSDRAAVLSMADQNHGQVVQIYKAAGFVPVGDTKPALAMQHGDHTVLLSVLSQYALDDLAAEVPNAFGGDRAAYRRTVETLMDHVPRAVDRLLG